MTNLREFIFVRGRFALPVALVVVLLCAAMVGTGFAQIEFGVIRGQVIEEGTSRPVFAANIVLLNTRLGAASDRDGNYEILRVPPGTYTMEISFIGFKTTTREIAVVANQEIRADFALATDVLRLDEIVVTGTGVAMRKKELTTSIQTISAQEIEASPASSIEQLLSGRLTGGQVRFNSGQPGKGAVMRLRGITSTQIDQTPVIYIDGVRVENRSNLGQGGGGTESSALSDIHVDDIERIEVIKSGAAATLYGSEAAAGVIQIFTKKGRAGKTQWRFNINQGFDQPELRFLLEPLTRDLLLKTGHYQKYSVNVTGGTAAVTYNVSGSITDSEGSAIKNNLQTYTFATGIRMFMTEKVQWDITVRSSRDWYQRFDGIRSFNGPLVAVEERDPPFSDPDIPYEDQKAAIRNYLTTDDAATIYRYMFGSTINYEYNEHLSSVITLGIDYRKSEARNFTPIGAGSRAGSKGNLSRQDKELMTFTMDYRSTIKYSPFEKITNAFTFGAQGFRRNTRQFWGSGNEFGLPGTFDFDNAASVEASENNIEIFNGGFYFSNQTGFSDKFFLNIGYRIDANSSFGDQVDFEAYPRVSAAYNISDEDFWIDLPGAIGTYINPFKIRWSYGETGAFPAEFVRDRTFSQNSFDGRVAASFGNPGNPSITAERTKTYEIGFDAALFSNRVGLEYTYYTEKTYDAMFPVPHDPSSGLGSALGNVGLIGNKGHELSGNFSLINRRNFSLDINAGYSTLHNEVLDMGGIEDFVVAQRANGIVTKGQQVGVMKVNNPVPDANGEYTGDRESVFLPSIADKYIKLGLNFTIGQNFSFSAHGDGQYGAYMYDVVRYWTWGGTGFPDGKGREPWDKHSNPDVGFFGGQLPNKNYSTTSANIVWRQKTDYFKIREAAASYRLPGRFYGTRLTLTASVANPWVFAPQDRGDPEMHTYGFAQSSTTIGTTTVGGSTLSPARQWRFGVRVEF